MAFKDKMKQEIYTKALQMHEVLFKEQSGRGMAYRRGWHGRPYDRSWCSYPVYAAGRDNRKLSDKVKGEGQRRMNAINHTQQALGISRRELCRRLGLSHQAGIDYALERKEMPRYVILACLALEHGLSPEQHISS